MTITQTLESISIKTSDDDTFLKLKELLEKNFKNIISSKGKIISFYDENEIIQRRYFLKFISKLYSKQGKDINLYSTHHKAIKLEYRRENSLKIVLNTKAFFKNTSIILKKSDQLFDKYIIKSLKNNGINYQNDEKNIVINPNKNTDFTILDYLLFNKEHLRFFVNFDFDEKEYEKLKFRINNQKSEKFLRKFSMLANLLEEHFQTLGCNLNDDYSAIRNSYLELSKIYHPDKHQDKSELIKSSYSKKFQEISIAYESLKPYFREQESFLSA